MDFSGTDRFQVVDSLGQGGMGVVYQVYDRVHDVQVALKLLKRLDPANLYRFKREFRALRDVNHPNIVKLYDLVSRGEEWFFTMELVLGPDFLTYVGKRGGWGTDITTDVATRTSGDVFTIAPTEPKVDTAATRTSVLNLEAVVDEASEPMVAVVPAKLAFAEHVDVARLRDAMGQLAYALDALHAADMVHRDLKPSNVRVTDHGRLVLMDFGIVAELQVAPSTRDAQAILGTPAYMAPEQIKRRPITSAADWYAFGTVLYQALCGHRPFTGSPVKIMKAKTRYDPLPPSIYADGIPAELEELCMHLLHRNPRERADARDVFHVLGMGRRDRTEAVALPHHSSHAFVGRERELASLYEAYERARAGVARLVTVNGPSGMGKSCLLDHFVDQLGHRQPGHRQPGHRQPGHRQLGRGTDDAQLPIVLAARCHERETLAYQAVDGVADDAAEYLESLSPDERTRIVPEGAAHVTLLFPVLRDALGKPPTFASKDPRERRAQASAAFRELLAALTGDRPVIIRIDDLQWADDDSLELICSLLSEPLPSGLLVLATIRTGEHLHAEAGLRTRIAGIDGALQEISLGPLSETEQHALVTALTRSGHRIEQFGEALRVASAGHPMLLTELVRYVADTPTRIEPDSDLSLQNLVWRRIDTLWPPARTLIELLAIAGIPTPLSVLAEAGGLSFDDRERAATVLGASFLTAVVRTGYDPWLDVYHAKVRETTLAHLSADRTRTLHSRVAQALVAWGQAPAIQLARHFQAAGKPVRAAPYLVEAGAQAAEQMAVEQTVELYTEALQILLVAPDTRPLDLVRCRAWIGLAESHRFTRGSDDALDLLDRAQELAAYHNFLAELASIHHLRGNLLFPRGDLDGCLHEHEQARAYSRQIGSARGEAQALGGLGDAYYVGGRMVSARDSYEACIALSREHEFIDIEAANLCMCGTTGYFRNDLRDALRYCREAAALGARVGHARGEAFALVVGAWNLFEMNRWDEARRDFELSLQGMRRLSLRRYEPEALGYLAQIAHLEGRDVQARAIAEFSVSICRDTGMGFVGPFALAVLAMVTDDPDTRARALDEGEEILERGSPAHAHLWFYRYAMDTALAAGDFEQVEHYARALEEYTRAEPLPWTDFYAGRARALAAYRGGARDAATGERLRALLAAAERAELVIPARALSAALADQVNT